MRASDSPDTTLNVQDNEDRAASLFSGIIALDLECVKSLLDEVSGANFQFELPVFQCRTPLHLAMVQAGRYLSEVKVRSMGSHEWRAEAKEDGEYVYRSGFDNLVYNLRV